MFNGRNVNEGAEENSNSEGTNSDLEWNGHLQRSCDLVEAARGDKFCGKVILTLAQG